jgi:hypothetical protein
MKVPLWVTELAHEFWTEAGEVEPFPRDLRGPIGNAVPLSVMLLPSLSVSTVLHWLSLFEIECAIQGRDRPLKACLVACQGCGFAFIDAGDSEAERRFSVAHELAHFLRDYWFPRRRVEQRLGKVALEVLDGIRSPTPEERFDALLRSVPLGFHVHLLERDRNGRPATQWIADAEECADRLAFELLAPAQDVMRTAGESRGVSPTCATNRKMVADLLIETHGFPETQAIQYAEILLPSRHQDRLLLRLRRV